MAYNMTAITNSTSIFGLYEGINIATSNMVAYLTLVSLFIVLLMILLKNSPPTESVLASSLICLVISLGMMGLGVVNITWVIGFTLIAGLSAVGLYLQR